MKLLKSAMSLFRFGQACNISVKFKDEDEKEHIDVMNNMKRESYTLFLPNDVVEGVIDVEVTGKRVDHAGMKVELIGQIEMSDDKGSHNTFLSLENQIRGPGELVSSESFEFKFDAMKTFDSYTGMNVKLRYFIKVTLIRNYAPNIVHEKDFWVRNFGVPEPDANEAIKMEVGIEDTIQIEFEYKRERYRLNDVVIGKVYFIMVQSIIKSMELTLLKRESIGSGANLYTATDTITKYELMDGTPVRGECLPVRFFLGCYDLTPTYQKVNNKFSIRYYLNLILIDKNDRRYFKQHEIILVP